MGHLILVPEHLTRRIRPHVPHRWVRDCSVETEAFPSSLYSGVIEGCGAAQTPRL